VIFDSRFKHIVNLLLLKTLATSPSRMKAATLATIRSGKRLGRLLKLLGEEINIHSAPVIRIPPELLPLFLASFRMLHKYVRKEIEKLVEDPLRFNA